MRTLRILVVSLPFLFAVVSCSSVSTKQIEKPEEAQAGLVYFLPKKDVTITVTIPEDSKTKPSISIGTSDAYPNLERAFKLNTNRNLLANNLLDISVNDKGLLEKANITLTSQVKESLENLAESIAFTDDTALDKDLSALEQGDATKLCKAGTYSIMQAVPNSEPEGNYYSADTDCPIILSIKKLGNAPSSGSVYKPSASWLSASGVYYATNEPYMVTARVLLDDKSVLSKSQIVLSPSNSPAHLLPIKRTFFADSDVKVTLVDGVVTQYNPDTKSELVELFNIPAAVINKYLDAVVSTFTKKDAVLTAEQNHLKNELELEKAKFEIELCRIALESEDPEKIKDACEGK